MHMRWKCDDTTQTAPGGQRLIADQRGSVKRTVLLLILLLVLAAAAVLLLYPDLLSPPEPEPAKPAANQVKRKVVQLPQKPAAQPQAQAQAETPKPAPQPAADSAEVKATTLQPKAQSQPATEAQPVAEKPAAQPAPKPEAKPAPKPEPKPEPKPAPVAVAGPKGPYTVTAGAYLLQESVDQADKLVRKIGYTPYHSKVTRDIEVIRLKEGTYGEAEAKARVQQYKKEFSDEAFMLKGARGYTVYLGSYVGLDRARVHADRLYAQGVRVSEEKAVVPMALTMVRFGDFNDQNSASQAVAKAKAAGLEAYVSKVP